jgi:integrase
MIPLLEQFKGNEHLLVFEEQFSSVANFLKKLNGQFITNQKGERVIIKRGLNTIGEKLGIANLTSYVMRHTWATIAAELDVPKETISAALGHGKKTVTDIYIHFDRKKIDEANRKVIDCVFHS